MKIRALMMILATCLAGASAHADESRKAGDRRALMVACVTSEDALEIGVSLDRKLPSADELLYEKLASSACLLIPPALRRSDSTLVGLVASEADTDVWEVETDGGRTLFVAYDREPAL